MKPIVTADQIRHMDQMSIEQFGIPGIVLMENAGVDSARFILREYDVNRVVVFCGKGNNGGDGFVIARHLYNAGIHVDVFLVGSKEEVQGDARTNLIILERMSVAVIELLEPNQLNHLPTGDLIIDALLGTGITGAVRGLAGDVIRHMNQCVVPVISIDIPSGLNCDSGQFEGECVAADVTLTMAALKRGLVLPPGRTLAGQIFVMDISMPDQVTSLIDGLCYCPDHYDIYDAIPERLSDGHKGTFGKVGVIAGSAGMTGAAILASMAALRTGAGLVSCACPKSINSILEIKMTEVMTKPFGNAISPSLTYDALDDLLEFLSWADVAAIGPGLSNDPETGDLIRDVIKGLDIPFVLDADGINAFEGNLKLFKRIMAPCILTPHAGELARLLAIPIVDILADPIQIALNTAKSLDQVIVLKGAPTIIASPEGECYINPTGNSGMATGGSGDVLTGVIAGLLAQGCRPFEAAYCGVYLHGLAGDLAADELGEHAMVADDILTNIGNTFLTLEDWCNEDS